MDPTELDRAERTLRLALLVAVASTGLATVTIVAGMSGVAPIPLVLVSTVLVVVAIAAWARFVHQRTVLAVGRHHQWRLERCEVTETGIGQRRHVVVRLDSGLVLNPRGAISNSATLLGQEQVEVAGSPPGSILVRVPGTDAIRVFRATIH